MKKLTITDQFWTRYRKLIRNEMIPYQWNVLNDREDIAIEKERDDDYIPSEKSHTIENLKIAAGRTEGNHYGWLFQDSDVYKWLESAANSYALSPDDELKEMMEEIVSLIEDAQEDDGYLSTFYQIEAPELKFRRLLESHELYCAGHLIEAAVAYFKATGDKRLLTVSEKFVNCIEDNFGPEEGKIHGADGHQEIELALVKLYEVTNEERYLELSHWFLEIRGQDPKFYEKQLIENNERGIDDRKPNRVNTVYHQAHKPVKEQDEAVGHAVRLVYMAAAMAEVAYYQEDKDLLNAATRIWNNIVKKRMYITGGIGSTVHGEAFTFDYDLPNDTMYCETCAAIGLMFFAKAMLKNNIDSEYVNVLERCIYNSVISGMALDGKHFFYVNPLEVNPNSSRRDPGKSHVKATRPSWFGCACCPPNLARTLTSLEQYIYSVKQNTLFVHLYVENEGQLEVNGQDISIKQAVNFSDQSVVQIHFDSEMESLEAAVRIPEWTENIRFELDNKTVKPENISDGYAYFKISGSSKLNLYFETPIIQYQANPQVKDDVGKVAIQKGPFVYCLEEIDNQQDLHLLSLEGNLSSQKVHDSILGEYFEVTGEGLRVNQTDWKNQLYRTYQPTEIEKQKLRFIPYYLWANREIGEMAVWVNKKE